MSKICIITKKTTISGNNVSHANNRTKRKFLPNLQNVKLYSQNLNQFFTLKITVRTMKSVEKNGGFDNYLLKTNNRNLAPEALKIKRSIVKQQNQ